MAGVFPSSTYPTLSKYAVLAGGNISAVPVIGNNPPLISLANGYYGFDGTNDVVVQPRGLPSGENNNDVATALLEADNLFVELNSLMKTPLPSRGTQTITPGVYTIDSFDPDTTLTLEGSSTGLFGNQFVFIVESGNFTFGGANLVAVNLTNGLLPENIVWYIKNGSANFQGLLSGDRFKLPGSLICNGTVNILTPDIVIDVLGTVFAKVNITVSGVLFSELKASGRMVNFPSSSYPLLSNYALVAAGNISESSLSTTSTTVTNGYWTSLVGSVTKTLIGAGNPSGENNNNKSDLATEVVNLVNEADIPYPQDFEFFPAVVNNTVTFYSGSYNGSATGVSFLPNTTLIFNAQNDPNAQFIINGSSKSTTGIDLNNVVNIDLQGDASASNIFWNTDSFYCSSAVLQTLEGTILVSRGGDAIIETVPTINGRIYTPGAGIVLDNVQNINLGSSVIPCYFKGTQILTDDGYVAIETLKPGDKVQTFADIDPDFKVTTRNLTLQSVVSIDTFTVEDPTLVNGLICLSAGCLGDDLPLTNLYVSPDHGILVNGYIVPARTLVNDDTIYHERTVQKLDYYHIELESHVCIKANGALSESLNKKIQPVKV